MYKQHHPWPLLGFRGLRHQIYETLTRRNPQDELWNYESRDHLPTRTIFPPELKTFSRPFRNLRHILEGKEFTGPVVTYAEQRLNKRSKLVYALFSRWSASLPEEVPRTLRTFESYWNKLKPDKLKILKTDLGLSHISECFYKEMDILTLVHLIHFPAPFVDEHWYDWKMAVVDAPLASLYYLLKTAKIHQQTFEFLGLQETIFQVPTTILHWEKRLESE